MQERLRAVLCASLLLLGTNQALAASTGSDVLTRGEAVSILLTLRTKSIPLITNAGQFPDVPKTHPYSRYLLAAAQFGIITPDSSNNLHPDDPVTRASFVKMITLTFGLTTHMPYLYQDVPTLSWFAPYAGIATHFGFFTSSSDGQFHPDQLITRTEAQRVLQVLIDSKSISPVPSGLLLSTDQSAYQLQLYQKISSAEDTLVGVGKSASSTIANPAQRPSVAIVKDRILALVNAERAKAGVAPLHLDTLLANSAQRYAQEMLSKNFFGHVSPNGETLRDRMLQSGYYNPDYQECNCIQQFMVGENLARGQRTADEVVQDWMKSTTHREVLLNPTFNATGIGVAAGIWVEHFGGVRHMDEQ